MTMFSVARWYRGERRHGLTMKSRRTPIRARRLLVEALESRRLLNAGLGNWVWHDANANGLQDATEPGVAGAVVEVFASADEVVGNSDDSSVGVAITDASGGYAFLGLTPGNYYLDFRPPVGYAFASRDQGSDDTKDSDADSTGRAALFTLSAGQTDSSRDAGLVGAAPGFGFALGAGSTGGDAGNSVATDAAGNVYVTGSFQRTVEFDPGPGAGNLTSAGEVAAFVAKYTAAGALAWARQLHTFGNAIAVDGGGNVYTTGYFVGSADFDPGPGIANLTSAGSADVFVSKLDNAGNYLWARQLGGSSNIKDEGRGITVDGSGNVYTTGYFGGTADFDPGPGTANLTSTGYEDAFVSKLDSAGNYVWARQLSGRGSGPWGYGIALDSGGNVYTTGSFVGTVDFDPGAGTYDLTSAGSKDVFVSKLDSTGNFVWAGRFGGSSSDEGYGIAVDGSGNIHTTGYFQGTADFDPGGGTAILTSAGIDDAFVSKLDSAGNFIWARQLGGSTVDDGCGIAVDGSGSVYTTGAFSGTADFDPGGATHNLVSAGGFDVFVSKLDSAGNFLWARQQGGAGQDNGFDVAVDGLGNVDITGGFFSSVADFDPGPGTFNLINAGGADIFLSKLTQPVTQIRMTIAETPSATGGNGEGATLPASLAWVHEWKPFWVEIWVSTPDTTLGVARATVDLQYNTSYLTAQEIQYGPAFTQELTGTIDDSLGRVSAIGGATTLTDVGDDAYVLLARVRFASTGSDQAPVDELGRNIGPYNMQFALANGQTQLVGGGPAVTDLAAPPATTLWAVMYDLDDSNLIDFGDFSYFAPAFGRTVGLPSSEPPYAWWADFDKSGVVDYGDLSFLVANFGKSRAGGQAITFPTNFPTAWARAPQAGPGDALRGDAALDQASAGAALLTPEVNGDGRVTPLDALILINAIHVRSASSQSNVASPLNLQPPYLDPNLDGYLTAADVLTVINYLNGTGSSLAGESEPPEPTDRTASGLAEVAPAVRLKGAAGSSESGEASARVGTSSVGDWQQAKNDPSPPPSPRSTGARELSLRSDAGGDAAADAPQDPLFAGLLRELAPLEDVLSELARDIASARCRRGA